MIYDYIKILSCTEVRIIITNNYNNYDNYNNYYDNYKGDNNLS